jgi:HEAT repeat protein
MKCFPIMAMLAIILQTGCGGNDGPLMSHGKPVAHWLQELKKADPKARKQAVVALGHVGKADPAAIPAVIGAVQDRDPTVRDAAVLALLNIGPDAKDAVAALTEASHDKNATVRSHAVKALERIQARP